MSDLTELTLPFHLRYYRKNRALQLKPAGDSQIHYSLLWGPKDKISLEEMDQMRDEVVNWLKDHDWKLCFSMIIARPACCYGRFDTGFEDVMFGLRDKFPSLERKKDLPWEDHVGELEPEERPIVFHIAHSASTKMPELNAFLKSARPGCNKKLHLEISVRD